MAQSPGKRLGLYRMRVVAEGVNESGEFCASGKAVCAWALAVAVDAV